MSATPGQDLLLPSGSLQTILKSQYHAALAMLRDAIERCPEDLWNDDEPTNAFWQVAYHALFFTHLYLQPTVEAFRPWEGHQGDVQHPDGIAGPPDPASTLPLIPDPYAKEEVLAYWAFCDQRVDTDVDALDLISDSSGFYWYPISKLEHQLVNIRHTQHHAAQLADRIRNTTGDGVRWVGARRPDSGDKVTDPIDPADREAIEAIVATLEAAWNAADGTRFGGPFSSDADFVTIRAEHFRGRQAIAKGHDQILRTIYAGSVNRYTVESIRLLRPDVALAHARSQLDSPTGPLAGRHGSLFSLVLTREAEGWQVAAFHNTLVPPG